MQQQKDTLLSQSYQNIIKSQASLQEPIKNLFYDRKAKAINDHFLQKCIITNPKALKKIIQGIQLKKVTLDDLSHYLQTKRYLFQFLQSLMKAFPLNCVFLQQCSSLKFKDRSNKLQLIKHFLVAKPDIMKQANQFDSKSQSEEKKSFQDQEQSTLSLFAYSIKQYYFCCKLKCELEKLQLKEQDKENKLAEIAQNLNLYNSTMYQVCILLLTHCPIKKQDIKLITQSLTDFFYQDNVEGSKSYHFLNLKSIKDNFQLFSKALRYKEEKPYIYSLEFNSDAIKILMKNNKWNANFSKGITIFFWFKLVVQSKSAVLLFIKNDQNADISLKVSNNNKLIVVSSYKNQKAEKIESEIELCQVPINSMNRVSFQLAVASQGIFKATQYQLNIKFNNQTFMNLAITLPKLSSSQFITDFSLLHKFTGTFHSLILSNRPEIARSENLDQFPQGLSTQKDVFRFFQENILDRQNILCILNADRAFKGTLINYCGQSIQGCFGGKIVQPRFIARSSQEAAVLLPYLYFLNLIRSNQENNDFTTVYDQVIRKFTQILINSSQPQHQLLLYVLYFLEISRYSVTAATIQWIFHVRNQQNNFYLQIVTKYIDVHLLLAKGISLQLVEDSEINPVQKLQLLFYLQTKWKQSWNQLQGFQQWWSPAFFKLQNNQEYDSKHYRFIEDGKNCDWSVRNYVSNDYCKCLLQPIFELPKRANLEFYQNQYLKKQLNNQPCTLALESLKKDSNFSLVFHKNSGSRFNKLKSKIKSNFIKQSNENNQIVLVKREQFDIKQTIMTECCLVNLLTNIIGDFILNKQGFIIFTIKHNSKRFDHMCIKAFKSQSFIRVQFHLKDIVYIRRRRYNQSLSAMQFRLKNGQIHLFYFFLRNLQKIMQVLEKHVKVRKNPYQYYLDSDIPINWIDKQITNFQYLMWLNDASGRSYADITQYPVLPWVVVTNDQSLDAHSDKTFRPLQKNMGSIGNQDRIRHFLQKYESYNQAEIFNEYHFGTHYSSSAIIFNYLIRLHPFSVGAITLQSGKFDVADRVFGSYHGSWMNATNSPTDIRQLVPEIYTLPQMMYNKNNYDFGVTQSNQRIDNVELPKWANQNPFIFAAKLRQLLESQTVSKTINNWIDLIFGFKQRGQQAVKHMNIFFPLTYQQALVVENIEDPDQRISIQTQIAHFGQNPSQIIGNNPHPQRPTKMSAWEGKLLPDLTCQIKVQKFSVNKNSDSDHYQQFHSVFQNKDSVLSIKFFAENQLIVIQKHQYFLFKMITNANNQKKSQYISKQHQIEYPLQSRSVQFDYRNLLHFVPVTILYNKIVLIGGFYSGYIQIIFIGQPKFNDSLRISILSTITAMSYDPNSNVIYLGDSKGKLVSYYVAFDQKRVQFVYQHDEIAHDGKINSIQFNKNAGLIVTSGEDGVIKLYNAYSLQLYRVYKNPSEKPVSFAILTSTPIWSVYFFCTDSGKLYSYSINGQFLAKIQQKAGFLSSLKVLKSSSKMEFVSFVNNNKQLLIYETPFLKLRRKIRIRKDQFKVICMDCADSAKAFVAGSEDGFLSLIGDKELL